HFAYLPLSGDGTIVARVVSTQNFLGYGSAGVMIRETLNPASANAKTAHWPFYGSLYFDFRTTTGGPTNQPGTASATVPYWVKVVRSGNNFSSYIAADGTNWTQLGTTQTATMAQNVYVGLAVTSSSTNNLGTATFDSVLVTAAAPPATVPPVISSVSPASGGAGSLVA